VLQAERLSIVAAAVRYECIMVGECERGVARELELELELQLKGKSKIIVYCCLICRPKLKAVLPDILSVHPLLLEGL